MIVEELRHSNKTVNVVTLSEAKGLICVESLRFFAALRMTIPSSSGFVRAP